jgi:transcriptional regulator with XRE-family HTH domain
MQNLTKTGEKYQLLQLGDRIRKLRIQKGISQTELAYSCNKDRQSLSRLENGKCNPGFLCLLGIANALEIPLNEFFNYPPSCKLLIINIIQQQNFTTNL